MYFVQLRIAPQNPKTPFNFINFYAEHGGKQYFLLENILNKGYDP